MLGFLSTLQGQQDAPGEVGTVAQQLSQVFFVISNSSGDASRAPTKPAPGTSPALRAAAGRASNIALRLLFLLACLV